MTEVEYKSLEKRAAGMLRKYSNPNIEPLELIHETLLKFGDLPEDQFAIKMNSIAGMFKINGFKSNEIRVSEHRICRMCNETKESGWFRSWYVRGYLIYDSYCRLCKNMYLSEYKKNKRSMAKQLKARQ